MSWTSAPKTAPLSSDAVEADRLGESVREPGHPRPDPIDGTEVHVAGARERRDVRGIHVGEGTTHPQRVADRGQEQRLGEGRLDEVVGAGVDTGRDVVEGPRAGSGWRVREDDDRHRLVGGIGADPPAGLDPVTLRLADPEEDRIGLSDCDGGQGRAPVGDRPDLVAGRFERRRQRRVAPRYILDDEDQSTAVIVPGHARHRLRPTDRGAQAVPRSLGLGLRGRAQETSDSGPLNTCRW